MEAPTVDKALTGLDFDCGISDGLFLDNKTILVAGDNGTVELVKLCFSDEDDPKSSFFYLEKTHSVHEHDDLITGLCLEKDKLITCSYDKSLVLLGTIHKPRGQKWTKIG